MAQKRITTAKQREGISAIKVNVLSGKTPAQIDTWVDNNVTNLESAKTAIKYLARAILAIGQHIGLLK